VSALKTSSKKKRFSGADENARRGVEGINALSATCLPKIAPMDGE